MQPQTPDTEPSPLTVGSDVLAITSPVDVVGRSRVVPMGGKYRITEILPGFSEGQLHARVGEIKEDGTVKPVPALFHLSSFRAATA